VFLNAGRTAESGDLGSYQKVFHDAGFTGLIASEAEVIDTLAWSFGLDFLEGFFDGRPAGELLWELRRRYAPLGLLYGTYCPPGLRFETGPAAPETPGPPITWGPMGIGGGVLL
jgi:hypothetical protein